MEWLAKLAVFNFLEEEPVLLAYCRRDPGQGGVVTTDLETGHAVLLPRLHPKAGGFLLVLATEMIRSGALGVGPLGCDHAVRQLKTFLLPNSSGFRFFFGGGLLVSLRLEICYLIDSQT